MLTLAAALALTFQANPPGGRIEPFPDAGPLAPGVARHCSADGLWCADLLRSAHDVWVVRFTDGDGRSRRIFLTGEWDEADYRIWPHLVRGADGSILLGVQRARNGGFSGGGWQTVHLLLYRVPPDRRYDDGPALLELPLSASASIRTCFDARDRRRRRDACTDDYSFTAEVRLGAGDAEPLPVLNVSTTATTFPGRRSRTEDSRQSPPLRQQDLTRWRDPTCSYVRAFRFVAAAGRYQPENPVPACDDYLDFE